MFFDVVPGVVGVALSAITMIMMLSVSVVLLVGRALSGGGGADPPLVPRLAGSC